MKNSRSRLLISAGHSKGLQDQLPTLWKGAPASAYAPTVTPSPAPAPAPAICTSYPLERSLTKV